LIARQTFVAANKAAAGTAPSFFNASFHDRFNVVAIPLI